MKDSRSDRTPSNVFCFLFFGLENPGKWMGVWRELYSFPELPNTRGPATTQDGQSQKLNL